MQQIFKNQNMAPEIVLIGYRLQPNNWKLQVSA